MRAQLAMFLVLAGGVAGCSSSPPPPPMAMAPDPVPMAAPMRAPARTPVAAGPMDGTYSGTVEPGGSNGRGCRRPPSATARVRGSAFALGGLRGQVAADGTVSAASRRGGTMTGTVSGNTMDVNETIGRCSYHYVLNKA